MNHSINKVGVTPQAVKTRTGSRKCGREDVYIKNSEIMFIFTYSCLIKKIFFFALKRQGVCYYLSFKYAFHLLGRSPLSILGSISRDLVLEDMLTCSFKTDVCVCYMFRCRA